MTIKEWLEKARLEIDALDAELMLLDTLGESERTFLILHERDEIEQDKISRLDSLLERRAKNEPLAYILGHKEFYGREFKVDESVLIPRPETEKIVDIVRELAEEADEVRIWDIGTGSGCLAVTLKLEIQNSKVFASDVSAEALSVAEDNARRLGAEVSFTISDLAEKISAEDGLDVIVANLPYVNPDWTFLTRETLKYEPEIALYAEENGLVLIKKLLRQISEKKLKGAKIVLESDPSQQDELTLFAQNLKIGLVRREEYVTVLEV